MSTSVNENTPKPWDGHVVGVHKITGWVKFLAWARRTTLPDASTAHEPLRGTYRKCYIQKGGEA